MKTNKTNFQILITMKIQLMIRNFTVIVLMLFSLSVIGQEEKEEQYYLYNIVSFEGDFAKEDFKVYYDDGMVVRRLRDANGRKVRFKTPAGALMYFLSQGWEMYLNGATSKGSSYNGSGSSSTSSYWILRKPCTKKEFEKAVRYAVETYN